MQLNSPQTQQNKPNNDKRNKIIRISVTAGLAIILAVITSSFILSALNKDTTSAHKAQKTVQTLPQEQTQPQQQGEEKSAPKMTKDAVLNAIAMALFDHGLSSSSIKDSTVEDVDGQTQMHLVIDKANADGDALRKSIIFKLEALGATIEAKKRITAQSDGLVVLVDIVSEKEKTAVSADNTESKPSTAPSYSAPVQSGDYSGARVAMVIDDCGYSASLAEKLASVKYPLAMAVIPYTPYSRQTAGIIKSHGKVLFLHQPMQPKAYPSVDPGKGAILLNMPESLVDLWLKNNVNDLGGRIDGFNNHMGSALTENTDKMDQVFTAMKQYTNFYVDSYTSPASVAYDECKKFGLACAQNRRFIDNESDPDYIRGKLMDGVKQAKANGSIIMIGHLRDNTVAVLLDMMPKLAAMGVQFVPVRELSSK